MSGKTGGASKKMNKFPRILDFIQAHHPDLYSIFDDLALVSSLTPKRGASGITFLLPDASYIKELRKQTEGSDPEVATDMLFSLIIPMYIPDAKSWDSYKDDIPNLLNKKVEVSAVGSGEIKLKKGSLTLNKKFKPFSRSGTSNRGNMAVWDLKGVVEFGSAPESERKYTKKGGAAKKKGMGRKRGGEEENNDQKIRNFVKETERREREAMGKANGKKVESAKLCTLVNYHKTVCELANSGNEDAKTHKAIFEGYADFSYAGSVEAAFYLTFACRDTNNNPGINSTFFLSTVVDGLSVSVDKPIDYMRKKLGYKGGNEDVEVIIDNIATAVRYSTAKDIISAYSKYVTSDLMEDGPFKDRLSGNSNLKLLIDEFKFFCTKLWAHEIRLSVDNAKDSYSHFMSKLDKFRDGKSDIIVNDPQRQSCVIQFTRDEWRGDQATAVNYMNDFLSPKGMCREACKRVSGGDDDDTEDVYHDDSATDYENAEHSGLSADCKRELKNLLDSKDKDFDVRELLD